jgi:hypothetical protein
MNRMLGITLKILRSGRFSALVALAGLGLLFTASGVKAGGCSPLPYKAGAAAPLIPFVSPNADGKSPVQESEELKKPTIVGLWHLIYTAKSAPPPPAFPPTPFQFVESLKTWHADGTEFENAFLPPAGGDICFGVWKELGDGRVKLHHIGVMFATEGNPPAYVGMPPQFVTNIFTVDETDKVAPNGKTYSGFFDFKLYLPSACADNTGTYICTGTPIAEVTGTTLGTRITVD